MHLKISNTLANMLVKLITHHAQPTILQHTCRIPLVSSLFSNKKGEVKNSHCQILQGLYDNA